MSPLGGRSWDEWIARYGRSHAPREPLCHTIGIPLIVLSLPLFLAALVVPGLWQLALALFVVGWIFQFVGHAFEGKPANSSTTERFRRDQAAAYAALDAECEAVTSREVFLAAWED